MENRLLRMMFEPERWQGLLEHSALKGINKAELRQYATPQVRAELYKRIVANDLVFQPAHQAAIPKDEPGEFRIVYVGETCERVLCSLINDCLFELFPEMVHPTCYSYQKGIGCGKVVQKLSKEMAQAKGKIIGAKYDFHHYFDTVSRSAVMNLFNVVERKLGFEYGTEPVMNLLRRTWNNDLMFDLDNNLIEKWSGIRQGNAIGSWLADAVLYELDEYMSTHYKTYARYSDDLIVLGDNVDRITDDINRIVGKYGVSLNPKKVQPIKRDEYVKFLGFAIKGENITISQGRLKKFQKEIERRTIKANGGRGNSYLRARNSVVNYLYKGNGEHSWCSQILPIVNVEEDIQEMNRFVLDCIKACSTGKRKVGGLGYVPVGHNGVVVRGTGQNVKANRSKVDRIEGFYTLEAMRRALLASREVYDVLVMQM